MKMAEQRIPTGILVLIAVTIAIGAFMAAVLALSVGQPSQPSPALATDTTDAKQTAGDASVDPDEICKEGITGEWHFVINQVDVQGNAPASIEVTFDDGHTYTVDLDSGTGSPTAHYTFTTHLTNTLLKATAEIYDTWAGQFVVSHTPCVPTVVSTPTPTPTPSVLAATPTPTPAVLGEEVTPTPTPAVLGAEQLPTAGGLPPSEGGDSLTALLYVLLAGAAAIVAAAIAAGRWHLSSTISTRFIGARDGRYDGWTWGSEAHRSQD